MIGNRRKRKEEKNRGFFKKERNVFFLFLKCLWGVFLMLIFRSNFVLVGKFLEVLLFRLRRRLVVDR